MCLAPSRVSHVLVRGDGAWPEKEVCVQADK